MCLGLQSDSVNKLNSVGLARTMLFLLILDFCFCSYAFNRPVFFLGRLLRVDLIKPVSIVCLSVRTSVRPQKVFFDFNEIWYVGRGRRLMHDGIQYDPIQGQGKRSRAL